MRVLISAALGMWAALTSTAAIPATVLQPTSAWDIDYGERVCRLNRLFGTGKDQIRLVFEQVAPRSTITVMFVGKLSAQGDHNILRFDPLPGVQISEGQTLDAVGSHDTIVFWPRRLGRGRWGLIPESLAAQMQKADPISAEASPSEPFDERAPRVKWKDHDWSVEPLQQWQAEDDAFSVRADKVSAIVLNPGHSGSVSLQTGPLADAFRALQKCTSDSLKDWGIDPAVDPTIATRAHAASDPQTLFTSEDYPQAAVQSLKEDNFQVWLNIDAQGGISNCRVISDFAAPEINDAICGMIRRKETFVPARTKDGKSVPDFDIQSFVFKIGY
jgi:hypothetical protein